MKRKLLPRTRNGRRHGNTIYNRNFKCVKCGRVIGEYNDENKQRVVRSWVSICSKCYRKTKYWRKRKKPTALETNRKEK